MEKASRREAVDTNDASQGEVPLKNPEFSNYANSNRAVNDPGKTCEDA